MSKEKNKEIIKSNDEVDIDTAYKYFKHADDHYAQRINFFLVAESMLVISFVTSLTHDSISPEIGLGIGIIGLIYTSIWLYTNARLEVRIDYMIEEHLKKNDLYKKYLTSSGGLFSKVLLTYTLPISMNMLWIFFICYQLQINNPILALILIVFFVIMIIIGSIMDKTLPKYKPSNNDNDC